MRRMSTVVGLSAVSGAMVLVPLSPAAASVAAGPATATNTSAATKGSLPVGQARYGIPAGAVFVDPARGNDAAAGTQAAPKRTVRAALSAAPSKGTVVLRGGTYHEGGLGIFKPLTVQNYPGEAAWFDGSTPVTSWTAKGGGVWEAPWSVQFDHSESFTKGVTHPDAFVNRAFPMAAWPDMVFVGGRQLKQVDGVKDTVSAGEFAVDYAARKLRVGVDPAGKDVRASDLEKLFTVGSPDVTLQGFGVRRYANSLPTMGAIYLARQRNVIRNVEIEDVATTGVTFYSDGKNGAGTAERITVRRAGLLGIGGSWMDNGVVKDCAVFTSNNERFNGVPTAGGIKIGRTRGVTIEGNLVQDSIASQGIWLDESVVGFKIVGNTVVNNGTSGIEAELSSSGVIADNTITGGHKQGIYIYNSEKIDITNNFTSGNSTGDIFLSQDFRRQSNTSHVGRDPRYKPGDPTNTWLLRDINVQNNVLAPDNGTSLYQFYVMDKDTKRDADTMNITLNGNAFVTKGSSSMATPIGWGTGDNRTVENFTDPAAFAKAKGKAWTGHLFPATITPDAMREQSRALNIGVPLTAGLAKVASAPVGSRQVGTFRR